MVGRVPDGGQSGGTMGQPSRAAKRFLHAFCEQSGWRHALGSKQRAK